jgi:hypothetical protein
MTLHIYCTFLILWINNLHHAPHIDDNGALNEMVHYNHYNSKLMTMVTCKLKQVWTNFFCFAGSTVHHKSEFCFYIYWCSIDLFYHRKRAHCTILPRKWNPSGQLGLLVLREAMKSLQILFMVDMPVSALNGLIALLFLVVKSTPINIFRIGIGNQDMFTC